MSWEGELGYASEGEQLVERELLGGPLDGQRHHFLAEQVALLEDAPMWILRVPELPPRIVDEYTKTRRSLVHGGVYDAEAARLTAQLELPPLVYPVIRQWLLAPQLAVGCYMPGKWHPHRSDERDVLVFCEVEHAG